MKLSFLGFIIGCVSCIFVLASFDKVDEVREIVSSYIPLPQTVKAVKTNKVFDFAGEAVPTTSDCRERLDKQLLKNAYWHSSTVLYIKRANRYFPMMDRILAERGIPSDFKYLAVAESGLENARSHAGAQGFWQFMKAAGKQYGLEIYSEVDERYHVEKSTHAAAKYIQYLYKRFGTWTDAAAAYNVGPTAYARILKKQQMDSYYDLNLNSETAAYVFRVIAIKEIMQNPEQFGFYVDQEDKYPPFENTYPVVIDKTVSSLGKFAKENGVSYRILKYYNPWLREEKLTVKSNTYTVQIPSR